MALILRNFASADAGANVDASRSWNYKTVDTAATVEGAGYFNNLSDRLTKGDTIRATCAAGGTADWHYYGVVSNVSGVVVIKDVFAAHA